MKCARCGTLFATRPATLSEKLGVATLCDDCRFPPEEESK